MAKRKSPGLIKRGDTWHIKKRIRGYGRLNETTGATDLAEAERYLAFRLEEIRKSVVYGDRPAVTFKQAAAKFIEEHPHLRSLDRSALALDSVMPYIGDKVLEQVHDEALKPYIKAQQAHGNKAATINRNLDAVRRVLMLAARKWRHPNGMTWLSAPPLLERLPTPPEEKRAAYPLTWDEQTAFFARLPAHLANMALFDVNTGLRDNNVTGLRWEWEVQVPELGESVFIIPGEEMKNGEQFVLVLNRIARSVLDAQRGKHKQYVFTYNGKPVGRMLNTSWKKARAAVGLPHLRVHDLRHTFGHRLRAVGVSLEDRKILLAHKDGDVTERYSAAELEHLRECVRKIEQRTSGTVLRVVTERAQNGNKTGYNAQRSSG